MTTRLASAADREPSEAAEWPIRVMDKIASDLSRIPGFPDFDPDWPIVDKDTAAARMADFLRAHETQLQVFPKKLADVACIMESVSLRQEP